MLPYSYPEIQDMDAKLFGILRRYLHTKKRDYPLPSGDAGLCFTVVP